MKPKKKKRGCPSKLTPQITEDVCRFMRIGVPFDIAINYHPEINRVSFYNWKKWGALGTKPYADFFDAVQKARTQFIAINLDIIQSHATGKKTEGQWQAAAWLLERSMPQTFGRQVVRQEITGADGKPLELGTQTNILVNIMRKDPKARQAACDLADALIMEETDHAIGNKKKTSRK